MVRGALIAGALAIIGLGAGCGGWRAAPPAATPSAGPASLEVVRSARDDRHAATLRVLTYNVAALPPPIEFGRAEALREIGDRLGAMRARGAAPHVVFLQEAFIDGAVESLIARAGYAHVARGPDAVHPAPPRSGALGAPMRLRGEGVGKLVGGGLLILSDFPIVETRAFAYGDCAGTDCLANKGVLFARIHPPGAPEPIDMFTTHLNSQRSAKAPLARTHAAHALQIAAMERFVGEAHIPGRAMIFGGDFNMKRSPVRFRHSAPSEPYAIARYYCAIPGSACDTADLGETERGWRDTQDLQGFHDGARIRVRPTRLALLFDRAAPDALSDHSAYLVDYEISWRAGEDAAKPALRLAQARDGRLRVFQAAALNRSSERLQ